MDNLQEQERLAPLALAEVARQLYDRIVASIESGSSPQPAVDGVHDSVFVKSTDGQIILSNASYDQKFAGSVPAVGRNADTYLDNTILKVANKSDDLILHGCEFAEFGHSGRTANGDSVLMRSYKRSLLGIGHPRMAILGVTRIEQVVPSTDIGRIQSLAAAFQAFGSLDARDQRIATGIAQGMKTKALASELDVSEKTIENRRNVIYRALNLGGPTELVKILVRLQDNGFSDFGL